jgi:hypothetical protein
MTNCLLFQCGKPSHLCAPRVEGPLVIGNEITARKSQTDLTQAWRGDKEHILATYIEQVHNLPQGALLLPPPSREGIDPGALGAAQLYLCHCCSQTRWLVPAVCLNAAQLFSSDREETTM